MNIEYMRTAKKSYMIIKDADFEFENYELQMILHNDIACLLSFQVIVGNGTVEYWYDVTGMHSLEKQFSLAAVNEKQLRYMLQNLIEMKYAMEEYLLDDRNICFSSEMVFYDRFSGKMRFCYIPGLSGQGTAGIKELFEEILQHLDHTDPMAVSMGYDMYDRCAKSDFVVEDCRECLRSHEEENALEGGNLQNREEWKPADGWETGILNPASYGTGNGRKPEAGKYRGTAGVQPENDRLGNGGPGKGRWENGKIENNRLRNSRSGKGKNDRWGNDNGKSGNGRLEKGIWINGRRENDRSGNGKWENGRIENDRSGYGRREKDRWERNGERNPWSFGGEDAPQPGNHGDQREETKENTYAGENELEFLKAETKKKNGHKRKRKWNKKKSAADYSQIYEEEQSLSYVAEDIRSPGYTECFSEDNMVDLWELVYKGDGLEKDMQLETFPFFVGTDGQKVQGLIQARTVSRVHAKLTLENGHLFLEDFNSTNGTYLNHRLLPMNTPAELHPGDRAVFATEEYMVYCRKVPK